MPEQKLNLFQFACARIYDVLGRKPTNLPELRVIEQEILSVKTGKLRAGTLLWRTGRW